MAKEQGQVKKQKSRRKVVGAIAQLAERLHRIQEAGGATPPSSTNISIFLVINHNLL